MVPQKAIEGIIIAAPIAALKRSRIVSVFTLIISETNYYLFFAPQRHRHWNDR